MTVPAAQSQILADNEAEPALPDGSPSTRFDPATDVSSRRQRFLEIRRPAGLGNVLTLASSGLGRGAPLILLVAAFLLMELLLPLGTVVKIGADEDFELSKATLCLKGYALYTEIWDDQPPLITFVIAQVLKHVSHSIIAARLVSVCSAVLLLSAVFFLARRVSGFLAAGLTTGMLAASPGFIELSSSCMQEIPALAPVVAALCELFTVRSTKWHRPEILGGILFAIGLQMKLIGIIYLPLAAFILWLRSRQTARPLAGAARGLFVLLLVCGLAFLGLNFLTGSPLMAQLKQSWGAHFASARSFEYGSPDEHPFDWAILLRNWDTTVPALVGVVLLKFQARSKAAAGLPLLWLGLTLAVFARHRPWWSFYYVHNSIPLCWCAAVALAAAWDYVRCRRGWLLRVGFGVLALSGLGWSGGRVYLQEAEIRSLPRLSSCLVLKEVARFKPHASFLFSDEPIYSFYSGIPMPPRLATISLKQMWAGEMSNARVVEEITRVKPGLILTKNDSRGRPYRGLLDREYKLVYRDQQYLLYAHSTISKKAVY
jgi:hypothetical protein